MSSPTASTPQTEPPAGPVQPGAAPRAGSLFAGIRAALPALIPSERRVAEVCLLRADEVAEWSVAQLAAAAEVSTATVVRACQSIGFRGFQQLRMAFAREAGAFARDAAANGAEPPAGGVRLGLPQPVAGDSPERILDLVFEVARAVLADALAGLDRTRLAAAVDLLDGPGRLLIVGNGGSAPVAQDAALRFMSTGRSAEAPADAFTQQIAANGLSDRDVCLLVTGSGVNELTLRVAEVARSRGATVIAVTSYPGGPLAELADIMLTVGVAHWPLGSDTIGSRLPSLLLLTALHLAVSLRRQDAPGNAPEQQRALLGMMIADPGRTPSPER
jgi:DNA-binding MurR/RpiR family transcriptional regulator